MKTTKAFYGKTLQVVSNCEKYMAKISEEVDTESNTSHGKVLTLNSKENSNLYYIQTQSHLNAQTN